MGANLIARKRNASKPKVRKNLTIDASPLKPREADMLRYLVDYWLAEGISPSMDEVMVRFGFSGPSGAYFAIRRLVQKGYLTVLPRVPRSIRVVGLEPVLHFASGESGSRLKDALVAHLPTPAREEVPQ